MPFENVTRDGRIFWLGEASAVLLTDDLNALGVERDHARGAAAGVRAAAGAARGRADRRDRDSHRSARRRRAGRHRHRCSSMATTLVVRARSIALETGRVAGRRHRARRRWRISSRSSSGSRAASTSPSARRRRRRADRLHPPVAGVRELHQGPAGGDAGDRDHATSTPPLGADPTFDRGASRAVGRVRRSGRARARARGRRGRCRRRRDLARRAAFSGRRCRNSA